MMMIVRLFFILLGCLWLATAAFAFAVAAASHDKHEHEHEHDDDNDSIDLFGGVASLPRLAVAFLIFIGMIFYSKFVLDLLYHWLHPRLDDTSIYHAAILVLIILFCFLSLPFVPLLLPPMALVGKMVTMKYYQYQGLIPLLVLVFLLAAWFMIANIDIYQSIITIKHELWLPTIASPLLLGWCSYLASSFANLKAVFLPAFLLLWLCLWFPIIVCCFRPVVTFELQQQRIQGGRGIQKTYKFTAGIQVSWG